MMNTRGTHIIADRSMAARIRKLPAYLRDARVATWKKLMLAAGVLWIISPLDAIPDVIPVIGWLDDLGVFGMMVAWLLGELDRYGVDPHPGDGRPPVA